MFCVSGVLFLNIKKTGPHGDRYSGDDSVVKDTLSLTLTFIHTSNQRRVYSLNSILNIKTSTYELNVGVVWCVMCLDTKATVKRVRVSQLFVNLYGCGVDTWIEKERLLCVRARKRYI